MFKELSLEGRIGAVWESNRHHTFKGNKYEIMDNIRHSISTGIQIKDSGELVPLEFFELVGLYILNTFEYDDLISVISTLKEKNEHLVSTGRIELNKRNRLFHAYSQIEHEDFKESQPENRINLFQDFNDPYDNLTKNQIKKAALHHIGSLFIKNMVTYLLDQKFSFAKKYNEMETKIKEYWKTETCQKSIFPYLDTITN